MTDADYMHRALELAEAGRGLCSPNPVAGALLVSGGEIVGEGSHTYAGVDHAEVLALRQAGDRARGAKLYINLEPCSHQGRTPPCAEALVAAGVARVVAGMADPNPLVAGRGFERLRQAGVTVSTGLLEAQCRRLNEHFARYIQGGVFVTLKAAMTLDGRMGFAAEPWERRRLAPSSAFAAADALASPGLEGAGPGSAGEAAGVPSAAASRLPYAVRFTSPESLVFVHRLRHAHDAILTGIGTVLADDPLLTDRSGLPRRRPLLRLVLDSRLRLPLTSRLFQTPENLLLVCGSRAPDEKAARLRRQGIEIAALPGARPDLGEVLSLLRRREVSSLLLEAGSEVNASAIESGLVDKLVLFYAPRLAGGHTAPLLFSGAGFPSAAQAPAARISQVQQMGGDVMVEAYLRE